MQLEETADWIARNKVHLDRAIGYVKSYFGYPIQFIVLIGLAEGWNMRDISMAIPVFCVLVAALFVWDKKFQFTADNKYGADCTPQIKELLKNSRKATHR